MNWKAYLTAFVSAGLISFPQNIIGCADGGNSYDYYTSFFHNNLPDAAGYKPFYYVGYNFLYDDSEPVLVADVLAGEWAAYCGQPVSSSDASKFVNKFAWKDLNNLYFNLEKNQPLKIPDSVKRNSMTDYFMRSKDLEALGYLMYAKKTEPFAVGDVWEPLNRDSLKMDKLIKGGQQLYTAAKKEVFKLKYAYQVLRMAHYSNRYKDVINLYDTYSSNITAVNSVLQPLCLALKAGALLRTGRQKEAAYLFSKCFAENQAKRISNYLGFSWSVGRDENRNDYLTLCKNNSEKASLLSLMAMGSPANELNTLKEIYNLRPAAEELQVLAVREINKLEEQYLTPLLKNQPGGRNFYGQWLSSDSDSTSRAASSEASQLHLFLHKVAQEGKTGNSGLFETAAAYTAYMVKDYSTAEKYMSAARALKLTNKVNDQLMLTNLLVTISKQRNIDGAFEEQIRPSVEWLYQQAKNEKPVEINYNQVTHWRKFYCNLMGEILAKQYHQQGDLQKEVLCVGAADKMDGNSYGSSAVDFLRSKSSSAEVEKMFALMEQKNLNRFETFLMGNNVLTKAVVTDFAGTAFLRDYNYTKAAEWFSKATDKKSLTISTNPFIDLLYDQEEALPAEATFSTTKLAFAKEMIKLQQLAVSDKANAAKHYYRYALGLYNMTYYGHAWKLVEYYRSGSDGYYFPKNATAFQKEYYGCYSAHDYFKKAMDAATDKNVKARCLFMMSKCSQKTVRRPQYGDFEGNDSWDKYEGASKAFFPQFKNNRYFPQLIKEYSSTAFYQEARNSCSYLRDFEYGWKRKQ